MNAPNLFQKSNNDGQLFWCDMCEVYFSKCCHANVEVDKTFDEVLCCKCGDVL